MRTRITLSLACLAVSSILACSSDPSDPGTGGAAQSPTPRSKLAKADAVDGSCKGATANYCGGKSAGACWCDDGCSDYGDCCADAKNVCNVNECEPGNLATCPDGMTCNDAAECVEVTAAPKVKYECLGVNSGTMFDLTIVDVGDKEGEVYVNNGGAPQTFTAEYVSYKDNTTNQTRQRFLFGFDEFNAHEIPALYEVDIADHSFYLFAKGTVSFDGTKEPVVCYDMQEASASDSQFECLGVEHDDMFSLDVIDVGDEEATVSVNDGGAPKHYDSEYKTWTDSGTSFASHRFLFGFDEYNAQEIDDLYEVEIKENSISFAQGTVRYGREGTLVCHINK